MNALPYEIELGFASIVRAVGASIEPLPTFRIMAREALTWPKRGVIEKQAVIDRLLGIGMSAGIETSLVEAALFAAIQNPFERISKVTGSPQREAKPSISASAYMWVEPASLPTRAWLFERHLVRKFVSLTVAPGGIGKTALAVVEALQMVTGRPLLGGREQPPLRVWIWNGEDPLDEMQRRVQAACLHYGIGPDEIGDRLFLDSGRTAPIVLAKDSRSGVAVAEPVVAALKATVMGNGIDVLSIDPYVASHAVNENDNGKVAAVARLWAAIAEETNSAISLIHHIRKPGTATTELTADDARGAGALVAAARSVRLLARMTQQEGEEADVENHRLYFRVTDGKANLAPPADVSNWRKLENISLGNGAGGPDDQVGVVTAWQWPNPFDDVTIGDLREIQRRIAGGEFREDQRAANWAGKVVAEVLNLSIEKRSDRAPVVKMLRVWSKNGALRVVTRPDERRKPKQFVEVGELV